jgi:hypothetical protein
MRILKLFIAVVFSMGMFCTLSAGAQPATDAALVPSQSNPASSISEIATGNLETNAASPLLASLPDSSASGAVSVAEPTPAALHLTPAIPNGVSFTPTVTLPTPAIAPEPGAMLLAAAGSILLLRRPRH